MTAVQIRRPIIIEPRVDMSGPDNGVITPEQSIRPPNRRRPPPLLEAIVVVKSLAAPR